MSERAVPGPTMVPLAPAAAAPEQTPPQPRPTVMRQCAICLRRGPDLGLTSEERQAIVMGRSALEIPPDAVSAALVRWHDPQTPDLAVTREFRCEDHDRCWVRVIGFGDPWPVDDRRPRYDPDRSRPAPVVRSTGDDVGRSGAMGSGTPVAAGPVPDRTDRPDGDDDQDDDDGEQDERGIHPTSLASVADEVPAVAVSDELDWGAA